MTSGNSLWHILEAPIELGGLIRTVCLGVTLVGGSGLEKWGSNHSLGRGSLLGGGLVRGLEGSLRNPSLPHLLAALHRSRPRTGAQESHGRG